MSSQIVISFIALCVVGSSGFFNSNGSGSRRSQPHMCRFPSKPCRMEVTVDHLNGTADSEIETHLCTCAYPNTCNSDWSRSNHVISRNLLSTTHRMTLNMMFCSQVQPPRVCSGIEEALVLSGSLNIPYDVVSFNCRCNDSTPFRLKASHYGTNFLLNNHYVCDSLMPICPTAIARCASIVPYGITYNCKCPGDSHCRVPDGATAETAEHGYCRN